MLFIFSIFSFCLWHFRQLMVFSINFILFLQCLVCCSISWMLILFFCRFCILFCSFCIAILFWSTYTTFLSLFHFLSIINNDLPLLLYFVFVTTDRFRGLLWGSLLLLYNCVNLCTLFCFLLFFFVLFLFLTFGFF